MEDYRTSLDKLFERFNRASSSVFENTHFFERNFLTGDLVELINVNNGCANNGVLIYSDPFYMNQYLKNQPRNYMSLIPQTHFLENNSFAMMMQELEIKNIEDTFQLVKILSNDKICYCIADQIYAPTQ